MKMSGNTKAAIYENGRLLAQNLPIKNPALFQDDNGKYWTEQELFNEFLKDPLAVYAFSFIDWLEYRESQDRLEFLYFECD